MAREERIKVAFGLIIYREYRAWSVEINSGKKRIRYALGTQDKDEAIKKALSAYETTVGHPPTGLNPSLNADQLTIKNRHFKAGGALPEWATARPKNSFFSYFEGSCGDQWIFLATKESVKLAGGDCGWGKTFEIIPTVELTEKWGKFEDTAWPGGMILDAKERFWLLACLASCSSSLRFQIQKTLKMEILPRG